MVAGNHQFDDATHLNGATLSRGGRSLRHYELVVMEITVGVAVLASVRSEGASLIHDSCMLSCQLSFIPLILIWSNHDDHLLIDGRLFGLKHPHRYERVVSERVGVRILFAIRQIRKENALDVLNMPMLLHVHCVNGVQIAADLLV